MSPTALFVTTKYAFGTFSGTVQRPGENQVQQETKTKVKDLPRPSELRLASQMKYILQNENKRSYTLSLKEQSI